MSYHSGAYRPPDPSCYQPPQNGSMLPSSTVSPSHDAYSNQYYGLPRAPSPPYLPQSLPVYRTLSPPDSFLMNHQAPPLGPASHYQVLPTGPEYHSPPPDICYQAPPHAQGYQNFNPPPPQPADPPGYTRLPLQQHRAPSVYGEPPIQQLLQQDNYYEQPVQQPSSCCAPLPPPQLQQGNYAAWPAPNYSTPTPPARLQHQGSFQPCCNEYGLPFDSRSRVDYYKGTGMCDYHANPTSDWFRPQPGGQWSEGLRHVQQLQPERPEPLYAVPRAMERGGGEERHCMETPIYEEAASLSLLDRACSRSPDSTITDQIARRPSPSHTFEKWPQQRRHQKQHAPPPLQQTGYRNHGDECGGTDRRRPVRTRRDEKTRPLPIDDSDEDETRVAPLSTGYHKRPNPTRTGTWKGPAMQPFGRPSVQQLQQVRPDPKTRERSGRGREKQQYGGESWSRAREDRLTPEEEEQERFRLSLLDRRPRSISPEPDQGGTTRIAREERECKQKMRDSSERLRSGSPDYWAMANAAPWGSTDGLRQQILTLLNSFAQVMDQRGKEQKMVTVEFLIKTMHSYERGEPLKKCPDRVESSIGIFGFGECDITWMDFLRAMRDEGLLRIHKVHYAPHDEICQKFVDPRPSTL